MKLKKLLSLALCAVLLTSTLPPVHVHAEEVAAASEIAEPEATPTPTPEPAPTEPPVERQADTQPEQQANTLSVGPADVLPEAPTSEPTEAPTSEPTEAPTSEPTEEPTAEPTEAPTNEPTEAPTEEPTETPTGEPTETPTEEPTETPTDEPTETPTGEPTETPAAEPSPSPEGSAEPETSAEPEDGFVTLDPTQLDFLTADGLAAIMMADVPMAIDAQAPTINVSSKSSDGNRYCPPVSVTITVPEGEELSDVTVRGESLGTQSSFEIKAKDTTSEKVTIRAETKNGGDAERTITLSHANLTMQKEVIQPTCEAPGMTIQYTYCKSCGGEVFVSKSNTGKPLGHEYEEKTYTVGGCGSAEEQTITIKTCKRCNKVENQEALDKLSHDFEDVTEDKCGTFKKTYKKCKNCGYIKDYTVATTVTEHKFSEWEDYEPTCTAAGYSERHCENPGCSYKQRKAYGGDALGHRWQVDSSGENREATCKEEGTRAEKCSICNTTRSVTIPKTNNHVFVEIITKQPKCNEFGEAHKECSICGTQQGESYQLEKTNKHNLSEWKKDELAHTQICLDCKEEFTGAHRYTNETGSCTDPRTCSVCGYVDPAQSGHKIEWTISADRHIGVCTNRNCTYAVAGAHRFEADGDCTQGLHCTVCTYVTPQTTKHSWSWMWEDQGDGKHHARKCLNTGCAQVEVKEHVQGADDGNCETPITCGVFGCDAVVVPAKTHDWGKSVHDPDGEGVAYCQNEGCTASKPVPHTLEEKGRVKIQEKSCTQDEIYEVVYVCTGCETVVTKEEVTKQAGHTWGDDTEKESTCQGGSYTEKKCSVCGTVETTGLVTNEKGAHHIKSKEPSAVIEATCVTAGSRVWRCETCGVVLEEETVDALGHNFDGKDEKDVTIVKEATCTTKAVAQIMCSVCHNATFIDSDWGELKPHDYVFTSNDDANCAHNGTRTGRCTTCGAVTTEEIPGTKTEDHVYQEDYNCETADVCEVCGTKRPAQTHNFSGAWTFDTVNHYRACTNENCRVLSEGAPHSVGSGADCTKGINCTECNMQIVAPTGGHNMGPWTFKDNQNHEQSCLNQYCAHKVLDGHKEETYTTTVPATCTEPGSITTYTACTACAAQIGEKTTEEIPAIGHHTFGDWETKTPATCTADGEQTRKCLVCGITETQTVKALGHDLPAEFTVEKAAKCEEDGLRTAICKRCEQRVEEPIPALGHKYKQLEVVREATCTEPGMRLLQCERCFEEIEQPDPKNMPALGHKPDASVTPVVTAPTCTSNGYTTYTCSRCGEKYAGDYTDKVGHSPVHSSGYAPTCTSEGMSDGEVCSVCGAVLGGFGSIPALGHDVAYSGGYPATCTSPGLGSLAYCRRCGATISGYYEIPPLGHAFGGWASDGGGTHSASCGRCGERRTEGCAYDEIDVGGTIVRVCGVCGDVLDPTGGEAATASIFTPIMGATGAELDPGAIPAGTALIVRKLELPFAEDVKALEAFTVAYEIDGVALPLMGRVEVRIPLMLDVTAPFRLVRVDVTPETATTPRSEVWVALDYDYTDGVLTFVTDRDGLFLLVPMDAILR